jgi:hypothetical protein
MYIQRRIEEKILFVLQHFPAVALLGPRQVGKTTLVKEISSGLKKETIYLDMENPSDSAALDHPLEFFNSVADKTIVIDEIQRRPDLFPVLRSAIDTNRTEGRFILLGSASWDLLFLSNETLAGRIVYIELTPFYYDEISYLSDFRDHWLRGGYPLPFLQPDEIVRNLWFGSFITTYVERDLRVLGLNNSSGEVQRLLFMLVAVHGNLLNYNTLSNSLGIHALTIKKIISFFEKSFIVRLLQPWHANLGKRLVKSPKIYIRDSGIINHLLGLNRYDEMLRSPVLGSLWEGYVIEDMINTLGDEYQYYFYRTADGAECDLLISKGNKVIAAIDAKFSPDPKRTKSMTTVINDLQPAISFFVIPEMKAVYNLGDDNLFVATPQTALEKIREIQ